MSDDTDGISESDEQLIERAIGDALERALGALDTEHGLADLIPEVTAEDDAAVEAQVLGLFAEYLRANSLEPPKGGALTVDPEFLKAHGSSLMAHMLQGLAAQIAGDDEPSPRPADAPPPVKVDLSDALVDIFGAPPKPDEDPFG